MVRDFANNGYWAVVLGGSSGLGLAAAKKLAQHGMNLCIVHRNSRTDMEQIQNEFTEIKSNRIMLIDFNADVLNPEKQQQILAEIKKKIGKKGSVRCLLHSVAKGNLKSMSGENTLSNDDFQVTLQAMALSLYDWTKAIHEAGLFAKDARVLSFTSEGSYKAWPHYAAVSAAKAALEAISRNIALEFAPFGVRANCIQAGITDTRSLRMIPGNEKLIDYALQRNPFKKLTTPEEVANVVYLLCKDEAAWINGAVIPVNGGEHIN